MANSMNVVHFAMRRPVTIVVAVTAVALGAFLALRQMPRDIFPDLGIPTIYVAQPYGGMDPAQMEGFLTNYYEYHFLYLTGIEHVESKSIQGAALIKLQFHPGTNMAQATAETIAYVNRARAFMPPGTVPPFVMRFDAGSVPVGDLVFTSAIRSVAELQDLALFRVRPLFATLPGVSAPPPFGASQRSIVIRADPDRLRAYGLAPDDVVAALSAANTVMPSGNARIGDAIPMVPTNAVVADIRDLLSVPLRSAGLETVFLRDVATVEDGADIQTGYALVDGRRTVFIPVTKRADASTLAVVDLVKANLAKFQSVLPSDVSVSYRFDQSPYVTRAIGGLVTEGVLGALLTGLMVLLFLRDWRSALIVVLNIPIALLGAVLGLWLTGATINLMTLGGLALAVGILVDEATVTIENIHTHLASGATKARAALDATSETAAPRFLAMLSVLAVFVPSFFMTGAGRALFVPLSLAVGFSMFGSFVLSSTLVPILSVWILRPHSEASASPKRSAFDRFRDEYERTVKRVVAWRAWIAPGSVLVAAVLLIWLGPRLGTEIFPAAEAGQFQVRLHAPTGTRIERTEALALQALEEIKEEVGPDNVEVTLGFVGVQPPSYPINTIYLWTGGPEEAVMQVALRRECTIPVEALKERLRRRLATALPGVTFAFEPSDIVSRVMSMGSSAPVEVMVSGPNLALSRGHAEKVRDALARIPSLRDLAIGPAMDYPTVEVATDRERAGVLGVSASEVARSLVAATSSSRFVVPNFWADPKSGVGYQIQLEIPQERMNSLAEIENLPIARNRGGMLLVGDVAKVTSGARVSEYDRYNMQRTVTVSATIAGEDLGHVADRIGAALKDVGDPPATVSVNVRGQVAPMTQMLNDLRSGLLFAIAVVFLILAANFQSFSSAFVVISTVPAVVAGVALALALTHTTLNVQSFMGAIMAIGVAVANAILLTTVAERERMGGAGATQAVVVAGRSRLRPIVMTSVAMIAGMMPMALGLGEGGAQNAPLGIAVVGGLGAATLATLLVLPAVFALVHGQRTAVSASLDPDDPLSRHHHGLDRSDQG